MRNGRSFSVAAVLFLCLLSARRCAWAQETPGGFSDADLPKLLADLQANQKKNQVETLQYTSFELYHNQNWDKNGKLTFDESEKFENIAIEGILYRHKIEHNGKPLAGKEAEEEQKRYDKAVAERRAMTPEEMRMSFHRTTHFQLPVGYLATLFDNRIVRREPWNGRDTLVIESTPRPGAKPANKDEESALDWKETTWIDLADAMPARIEATLLADREMMKKGNTQILEYQRVPGPPERDGKPGKAAWLLCKAIGKGNAKIVLFPRSFTTEQTWSEFKRFQVDVRILDGSVEEAQPESGSKP